MKLERHHIEALAVAITQMAYQLQGSSITVEELAAELRNISAEFSALADEANGLAH